MGGLVFGEDETEVCSCVEHQDTTDLDYSSEKPKVFTQKKLNYLVRDLLLSNEKVESLESRLKQKIFVCNKR